MNYCYEKAAHKGLDYGEDQLEPPGKNSRVVRVVDCSGAFSWFGVSPRDVNNCYRFQDPDLRLGELVRT